MQFAKQRKQTCKSHTEMLEHLVHNHNKRNESKPTEYPHRYVLLAPGTRFISGARKIDYPSDSLTPVKPNHHLNFHKPKESLTQCQKTHSRLIRPEPS